MEIKYIILLVICITTIRPKNILCQNKAINNLNYTLFEKDIDSTIYTYSYWSFNKQDSVHIQSRYEYSPSKLKSGLVSNICDTIRWEKSIDIIPQLKELLLKQEEIFVSEWDPVFDLTGAPEGLWGDQFSSLCIIDLTISYLQTIKEKWSPLKRYNFVKNLYMLSYGDYNKTRLEETIYKSKYIREKRSGYCQCLLLKANYETSLIDEFFLNDGKIIDYLIEDIRHYGQKNLSEDDQKFYNSALKNILYKFPDTRIDSLLISDTQNFVNIGFQDKVDHWSNKLPVKLYHLMLGRYRFVNKNVTTQVV